jgi:hypothetical protein
LNWPISKGQNLSKPTLLSRDEFLQAARGGSLPEKALLENCDLSGESLSGLDLSGTLLNNVNLSGATLSETKIQDANWNGVVLKNTDLSGAEFSNSFITKSAFESTNLTSAKFTRVLFRSTLFQGLRRKKSISDSPIFREPSLETSEEKQSPFINRIYKRSNLFQRISTGMIFPGPTYPGFFSKEKFWNELSLITLCSEKRYLQKARSRNRVFSARNCKAQILRTPTLTTPASGGPTSPEQSFSPQPREIPIFESARSPKQF